MDQKHTIDRSIGRSLLEIVSYVNVPYFGCQSPKVRTVSVPVGASYCIVRCHNNYLPLTHSLTTRERVPLAGTCPENSLVDSKRGVRIRMDAVAHRCHTPLQVRWGWRFLLRTFYHKRRNHYYYSENSSTAMMIGTLLRRDYVGVRDCNGRKSLLLVDIVVGYDGE